MVRPSQRPRRPAPILPRPPAAAVARPPPSPYLCGGGPAPAVALCLRRLPARRIVQLEGTASTQSPYIIPLIADGQIIPAGGLFAAFRNGAFTHMPIMSGTVHDEYNFLAAIAEYYSGPPRHPVTAAQYRNFVATTFPPATAKRVFAEYPLAHYRTPQLAWNAV